MNDQTEQRLLERVFKLESIVMEIFTSHFNRKKLAKDFIQYCRENNLKRISVDRIVSEDL